MRTRGNGSGCVTSYITAKNKKRWRVRVLYAVPEFKDGNIPVIVAASIMDKD